MDLVSEREKKRWAVVQRVLKGDVSSAEGAEALGLSTRQLRRLCADVREHGKSGVVHGNRGRAPPNRISDEKRATVLALAKHRYSEFNDHHFTDKLREVEKLDVSRSTVRSLLRAAKVAPVRKRRGRKHRSRRERKAAAGQLLLWDGSLHDWLEGRGPLMCLVGAVDDATGELLPGAHFVERECAAAYLRVLLAVVREKGVPWSIYMDRHGSLHRNDAFWTLAEELRGEQEPTHVGAALKALEVEAIYALSPQAKGRVERAWGTLQDRLCSELRLARASTLEEANAVLERYRSEHNARFGVEAREAPAWRAVKAGVDVERVCSFRYEATVENDNTVRVGGARLQIPAGPNGRGYAKARVEVRQMLDGSWRVYARDALIATARSTSVGEVRALRRRRRSAEARAFRSGVKGLKTGTR